MVTGKLTNGFKFEIAEGAFSDYDYLVLATKYRKEPEDMETFDALLVLLLGADQRNRFVESFADKNGKKNIKDVMDGFRELVEIATEKSEEIKN